MGIQYILLFCIHLISIKACKTSVPADDVVREVAKLSSKPDVELNVDELKEVAKLPAGLKECSGMVSLGEGMYVAHNDNGNKPDLYVFNIKAKDEVRIVKLLNVSNNDWEELSQDNGHIYIGDFGNNEGTRQNLMVYKISKADLLKKDQVSPEIIRFRYEGQANFNKSNRHNFDCEAMIVKDDSLFLFTKNRGDFRTDVYGIPNKSGDYVTSVMGSFDSEGLITGADYRPDSLFGELVLIGYEVHGKALYPFVLHFPQVEGSKFFEGEVRKQIYRIGLQAESINFHEGQKVYITNEQADGYDAMIHEATLKN